MVKEIQIFIHSWEKRIHSSATATDNIHHAKEMREKYTNENTFNIFKIYLCVRFDNEGEERLDPENGSKRDIHVNLHHDIHSNDV